MVGCEVGHLYFPGAQCHQDCGRTDGKRMMQTSFNMTFYLCTGFAPK